MTNTPATTRRRVLVTAFLALALCVTPAVTGAASARSADARVATRVMNRNQSVVVDQVNRSRAGHNRGAIDTNGLMNQRAMKWAQHLAGCQCLEHRAAPFGVTRGWCAAAENVGRSGDRGTLGDVHTAFMHSSGHRANILNGRWTDLGVGVAKDGAGEYFVVHVFADYRC